MASALRDVAVVLDGAGGSVLHCLRCSVVCCVLPAVRLVPGQQLQWRWASSVMGEQGRDLSVTGTVEQSSSCGSIPKVLEVVGGAAGL